MKKVMDMAELRTSGAKRIVSGVQLQRMISHKLFTSEQAFR